MLDSESRLELDEAMLERDARLTRPEDVTELMTLLGLDLRPLIRSCAISCSSTHVCTTLSRSATARGSSDTRLKAFSRVSTTSWVNTKRVAICCSGSAVMSCRNVEASSPMGGSG